MRLLFTLGFLLASSVGRAEPNEERTQILVRSGWQTINIGDIAISPGILRLLERHVAEAEVTVELFQETPEVRAMIENAFPGVRIIANGFAGTGMPLREEYVRAMEEADLFLYSSGPIFSYGRNNFSWDLLMRLAYPVFMARDKGVPWGCYGQSFDRFAAPSEYFYREFLGSAEFLYCRDSDSVKLLREIGIVGPEIGFAPDATFAFDLRDDEAAEALLEELELEEGRYRAAVSHYRARGAVLEKFDSVLEKWLRETGLPVLLAPEVSKNLEQYSEELLPMMDEELRAQVRVMDRFWLPDEAASVLERATAVFSGEMHSIIIALAAGTPSMLFRLQGTGDATDALAAGLSREEHVMSDGLKGRMMEDIGLGEWLVYHAEESDPEDVGRRLVKMFERPVEAREKLREAMQFIEQRQAATMETARRAAGLPGETSRSN